MKTGTVNISSASLAYQMIGDGKISLVVEMGLGTDMAEWHQIAERLAGFHTVLLYHRAGYGGSSSSSLSRTPETIAAELHALFEQLPHEEKVTLLAHSQGGLYAWKFAKMYPEMVEKLILLDPLSPEDYRFRMELTEEEFRKSGVDKTEGLRANLRLIRAHLGWLVRRMMRSAPPFYYYDKFSGEEKRSILSSLGKPQTYETALEEYAEAHDMRNLAGLLDPNAALKMPVVLVTHNSDIACREIQRFGGASEAQALKIETLWQEIMKSYLSCAPHGEWICAEHSSHSIHLTDQELVCGLAGGTSGSPDLQKIIGNSTGRCTVLTGTDAASY